MQPVRTYYAALRGAAPWHWQRESYAARLAHGAAVSKSPMLAAALVPGEGEGRRRKGSDINLKLAGRTWLILHLPEPLRFRLLPTALYLFSS